MGDVMHSIYHLMMETAVVGRVQNMDGQGTEANPQQKTTRQNNKHAQAMEQTVVGDGFNGAGLQGCMFWVVGKGGNLARARARQTSVVALAGTAGRSAAGLGTSQLKVPSPFLGFRYLN